jgi:hypothetical protein
MTEMLAAIVDHAAIITRLRTPHVVPALWRLGL